MIATEALTPQNKIAVRDLNITGQEVALPAITTETGTRAKISRHFLKAQTVNIETIKNLQSDLFSGEYELVTGQDRR